VFAPERSPLAFAEIGTLASHSVAHAGALVVHEPLAQRAAFFRVRKSLARLAHKFAQLRRGQRMQRRLKARIGILLKAARRKKCTLAPVFSSSVLEEP